ncbi:MAG: hypothetical protein AAFO04_08835 [Cyanobacteria bacterium J06592_8]
MFFPKFLRVATATLFFSNPFLIESLQTNSLPLFESSAQAQVILTPASEVAANQWQTLSSKEANFTVLMPPGNPQTQTIERSSDQYSITMQQFILADEQGIGYILAYTNTLPFLPESLTPDERENIFEGFTRGMMSKLPDGKVRSQRNITLNGFPGQETEIEAFNGLIKVRVFLANSRLYMQVVAIPHPSLANSTNIAQFFNSFDLVESQAPVVSQKQTKGTSRR